MRLGLISDIHGNLHALDAVIAALKRQGVDGWVCAGDLVGYGPLPNECVERIAELGAVTVAGNHDLIALGRLSDERCIPLARNSLRWTRSVLRDDSRRFLEGLPLTAEVAERLVVAHGSLDDAQEYVTRPEQAVTQLRLLAERYPKAFALAIGHTHRSRAHTQTGELLQVSEVLQVKGEDRVLLNPGSVGQSRERAALAHFALVDLEAGTARFSSARYDTAGCEVALLRQSLPRKSCHLMPSLLARCANRLRGLTSRQGVTAGR
jgi:predicted phosphodiesterase